ncbi:hypothetical protein KJ611_04945 [Patescibacteria group bacterium]|nr:hypothetical protein [Patescibacteria group bacterium]MBU1622073.1 hypothetical protein [Nanoarchaeota archaeon]
MVKDQQELELIIRELKYVYEAAGEDLSKVLDLYFPNKKTLINWFYSNNPPLGKSPYERCKEGKQYELKSILTDLSLGGLCKEK